MFAGKGLRIGKVCFFGCLTSCFDGIMNLLCVLLSTGRSIEDNLWITSAIPNGICNWLLLVTQASQLFCDSWLQLCRPFFRLDVILLVLSTDKIRVMADTYWDQIDIMMSPL